MKPLIALMVLMLAAASPAHAAELPTPPPPSDNAAVWYMTADHLFGSLDDEPYQKLIEGYKAPDLEAANRLIPTQKSAMDFVRFGAGLDRCEWAVDIARNGPYTLLPHLSIMRRTAKLFAVSAQMRLKNGDADGAVADWLVLMRMSRHVANDTTLISILVQFSIDSIAIHTLATHLDQFDREALLDLQQQLQSLPPRHSVQESIAAEHQFAVWIRRMLENGDDVSLASLEQLMQEQDKAMLRDAFAGMEAEQQKQLVSTWLDETDAYYQRIHNLLGLPVTEFAEARAAFEAEVAESDNLIVKLLLPSLGASRNAEVRAQAMQAMLDAMIAYRLGGERAFAAITDPADNKPFGMQVTDVGVVVSSRLEHDNKPWSLTFPAGCARPLD